jgi:penicillin-binding protein 1A
LVLVALVLAIACWGAWATLRALPSGATLRAAMESCQIARIAGREYALCPRARSFEQFPKHVVQAAIASEDRAFYSHVGFQPLAIAGAMARNALRTLTEGQVVVRQGGSTITQQFARTILLDERASFSRKFSELLIAPQIEAIWTKNQILAGYLNVVPHAHGLNGLDAAARYFFGVDATELNLPEAALLIGMLPAPNLRDPVLQPDQAFDAGARVLVRMQEQKMISLAAMKRASSELHTRIFDGKLKRGTRDYERLEFRPYRDFVMDELAQRKITLPDDYRLLTNMDPRLQLMAVDETANIAGDHQAAGVFLRPSGELLAISGSRDYVENSFNRAFKMARSIGSTGKIFPMLAAHEKAGTLNRKFPTQPLREGQWPAEPNKRCSGNISLQFALAQSCNRPFTWLAQELGPQLTTIVKRFGLNAPDSPLLVPLGGIETSPVLLARTYAAMANGGQMPKVRALVAVLGRTGKVEVAINDNMPVRVMTPAIAKAMLADFRGPVESGTARASKSRYTVVYGKTGTSTSSKDALFVGITQEYVGAFWVGDDAPQRMTGMFGGGAPAKAFARVADAYYLPRANVKLASVPKVSAEYDVLAALRTLAQAHLEVLGLVTALLLSGMLLRMFFRLHPKPRDAKVMLREIMARERLLREQSAR